MQLSKRLRHCTNATSLNVDGFRERERSDFLMAYTWTPSLVPGFQELGIFIE